MVVAGDDVVDVGCAHGACRVVPPWWCPVYLSGSGWWGGGWVEADAFVVCFCEDLFPEFVPVCWQALASVGCGPWHVCRVPGGVWVVGWLEAGGGPGFGVGFLEGVGFRGWGVWWVGVFVWWVPVLGWWLVWCVGSVPLRPLLNSPPRPLGVLWVLVRAVPLLGGGAVCWWLSCGLQFFSGGWAGLAGGLSCWLCSGRVVLNLEEWLLFSLVVQVRPCGCWGCSVVAGSVGCVRVGGLFSCWLCCSRWVGRPGRSGSPSPPLSPPLYTMELPRPPDSVGELTR